MIHGRVLRSIPAGTQVGPYEVIREIGRGATALVVLARSADGSELAVKLRPRGVPAADRKFLREFESMRTLRMPGVVRVQEAGLDADHVWFSMEFVDGCTFLEAAESVSGAERVERVTDLGKQLLDVLDGLHAAGLAHRDIKPSNVLVDRQGAVRVLDFGIGRFFERKSAEPAHGEGTLPYMAPEQLAGLPGDERVDLFATGLMIHEALAGRRSPPSNPLGWITRTCLHRPPPLASTTPEVPRDLSHIVDQLLDVSPSRRPRARAAAAVLRRLRTQPEGQDWPEGPFIEPGPWWNRLLELFDAPSSPHALVLQGPAGSGRRRVMEQLQRHALLDGVRTIHVSCDVTRIGGPICQALEEVMGVGEDESWIAHIVAGSGGALRQMWPHLPIPANEQAGDDPVPTMTRVAEATAGTLARAAAELDMILVVHDLEQVDVLTARTLHRLVVLAEGKLRLALLHDARWSTRRSEDVVRGLSQRGRVEVVSIPPVEARVADAMYRAICPLGEVPIKLRKARPQRVVEHAYAALAVWRGEPWASPGAELWPLAVHAPLPVTVLVELVGEGVLRSPWVRVTEEGTTLAGQTARRAARSRLADLSTAARAIAETWLSVEGERADPSALARLYLLAGREVEAGPHARDAAYEAISRGRYAEARQWLFRLVALPRGATTEDFELSVAKAVVALITEAERPRDLLLDAVDATAQTREQHAEATLLRAAFQLRQGLVRPTLAEALRGASASRAPTPWHAVRALILATRCRLRMREVVDASRQLDRAEALLDDPRASELEHEVALLRTEVLIREQRVSEAARRARALLAQAEARGHLHDEARAAVLLARVLRLVGRRGEAEALARRARTAAVESGDLALTAEAELRLAMLLVERGDGASAHAILDATIRQIRSLKLDHRMPAALRVVLQVAHAQGDPHAADVALGVLRNHPHADAEAAANLVRWWRSRGDLGAARAVPAPRASTTQPLPDDHWGMLSWQLEMARAALIGGRPAQAAELAGSAQGGAAGAGFDELALYGQLLTQAATDADETAWGATCRRALSSVWTELCFGALELDARRRESRGDRQGALARWGTLRARCEELGYRPGWEEASGWLEEA